MKKILKIVFSSLFVSSFAYAELKGISKMNLLVEDLSSKAASCGITTKKIETSVKYILSNSRIRIIDKFQFGTPTLYIQATISNNSGLCYSNTKLQVYEYIRHPNSNNWGEPIVPADKITSFLTGKVSTPPLVLTVTLVQCVAPLFSLKLSFWT